MWNTTYISDSECCHLVRVIAKERYLSGERVPKSQGFV
jgi:hypothetical protein